MKKLSLLLTLLCIGSIYFFTHQTPIKRIAHAGGGLAGMTYTDSLDALNFNLNKYQLFEIDFLFTSDNSLVCLHDWSHSTTKTFDKSFKKIPPSLHEFEEFVADNTKYKNCTLQSLISWLEKNPDKKIVTDVKDDNIRALKIIASNYPDFSKRFIPQIYQPEEYQAVREMGYRKIIWTLYRYPADSKNILEKAKKMDLYAITMPVDRVKNGLALELKKNLGVQSYVHTINSAEEYHSLKQLGIDEIYSDWLPE
jgi:glycerophosphoryl diester phosphodiesterase